MVTTGFLTGILYGLIFLAIEDSIGYFLIGTHYTLLQVPISVAIYAGFFSIIGAFLGIFLRERYGLKPTERSFRTGSIVYLLTAFSLFYFGFELFAKTISLEQSMKQLLKGAGIWFLAVAIVYTVFLILIKKKAKRKGVKTGLYYWSAAIASTLFFVPIFKAYSSPSLLYTVRKIDIWLIISLAIFALGFYLISVTLIRKEKKSGWRLNFRSAFLLPLIIIPILFWIYIYPKDETINVQNQSEADVSRPNVILVMLDALRADHLFLYGYDKITSFNLAKFSQQAVIFEKAYSSSSWTKPSVATLLTGIYPGVHGANGWTEKLPTVFPTLSELLKEAGYNTVGISTNPFITRDFNFAQGFDHFNFIQGKGTKQLLIPSDPVSKLIFEMNEFAFWAEFIDSEVAYGNAKTVNESAFTYLDHMGNEPFFLYLHYMDPHQPYLPSKKHFSKGVYFSREEGKMLKATHRPDTRVKISDDVADKVVSRYDDEIRYVDEMLDDLFKKLEEDGYLENSMIIICADHGEEFLERGAGGHGHSMYQEQIHVPLIIKYPDGIYANTKVDDQVGLIDLVPTVLDYLDIPSGIEFDGESLMPLVEEISAGESEADELYFGEVHPFKEGWPSDIYAVIHNNQKLIRSLKDDDLVFEKKELYNLSEDPSELVNLMETAGDSLIELQTLLDAYIQRCDSIHLSLGDMEDAEISEEQIERLKALGYIK